MVNREEVEIRSRIAHLVESVQGDQQRSADLFQYVWTMMCVRRGLLRVVREQEASNGTRIVVEEVRTGHLRSVTRPANLDGDVEGLAVQALARILGSIRVVH